MAQSFIELPKDVLLRILSLLRVQDILAVEQTCKELLEVADTRHLWLVKLQELGRCCPLNLPLHVKIEELSCLELRSAVTKAIRWSEACKNGLALSPETRISSIRLSRESYVIFRDFQFTPGGKHIIISHRGGFTIFCVRTGGRVCQWTDNRAEEAIFISESFTENSSLVLIVYHLVPERSMLFKLVRLDFETEQAVHVHEVASHPFRWGVELHVALDGNFAAACGQTDTGGSIFVWNWQTDWSVEILFESGMRFGGLHIKHGYLFFLFVREVWGPGERREVWELKLGVLALEQLSRLETSTINFDDAEKALVTFELPDVSAMVVDTQGKPTILCFALQDSSRFGVPQAAEACVIIQVFKEERELHLTACGFNIDFGDTEEGRKWPIVCPSFRTSCSVNLTSEGYRWPRPIRISKTEFTRQVVTLVVDMGFRDSTQVMEDSYYLTGTDERNGVFSVPLSGSLKRDGINGFALCKTSGVIAHTSGCRHGDVDVHVHYIP